VGLKGRVRKLEKKRRNTPEPPCKECGGRIICEEILPDGSVRYPHKEPCPACGSHGSGGRIDRIIVDMRDPEDRLEERGETSDRGTHEWP
jgi:hypothetical protein